jgi:signal transduction histidine kinase
VATFVQRSLWPFIPASPHLLYYPAVLLVARFAGFGPALLATLLSLPAINYWFLPPLHSLRVAAREDMVNLMVFAALASFLSFVVHRLLQSNSKIREAEDDYRLLSRLGAATVETVEDSQKTAEAIAREMVPAMADWCFVAVTGENSQRERRLAVTASDPMKAEVAQGLRDARIDFKRPLFAHDLFESNQPRLLSEVSQEWVRSICQDDEVERLLAAVDPRSFMGMPLLTHGHVIGSIVLISSRKDRRYTARDLHLGEQVAHHAALAIENAVLYEKAHRATQARDLALGVVAHDLRNPLGAILMAAGHQYRAPGPDGRAQKTWETIQRTAARMSRLIDDLLDVSRIEAGQLSVQRGRIPAQQVLLEAAEGQKSLIDSAGLELRLDVAGDLPAIWVDRDRILQIFGNLIDNAVKFTPRGGRIVVGAAPKGGDVLFRVENKGVSIPAEQLPHLFDRFWQGTQGDRRGAGLGLRIVEGIVQAHGGRLWVESSEVRGTTFYFTLPVAAGIEESYDVAWRS